MEGFVPEDNDVLCFDCSINDWELGIYKLKDMRKLLVEMADHRGHNIIGFLGDGVECELLQVKGNRWIPGRVELFIKFIPDELEEEDVQEAALLSPTNPELPPGNSESPLDDLRSELNLKNE